MSDLLVHAEKTLMGGLGQAEMRDFIAGAIGLACDLPKTCGTWCGKRRQLSQTSKVPEKVTCLPCREAAAADQKFWLEAGESLLSYPLSVTHMTPAKADELRQQVDRHRDLYRRYSRI